MAPTTNHGYNTPATGATDWDTDLNDNFEQLDTGIEIRDSDGNKINYIPQAGAKFLATDTEAVYVGSGTDWIQLQTSGLNPTFDTIDVNNLGVSVYRNSSQTIQEATVTPVQFNTTIADDRGEYNTSTDEFVCANDGDYHIESSVAYRFSSAPPGGRYDLLVRVNGVIMVRDVQVFPDGGSTSESNVDYIHLQGNKTLRNLSSGDAIEVATAHYTNGGNPQDLFGTEYDTYFTVNQIG